MAGIGSGLSSMYNSRMMSLYPMAMMNPQFGSFGGMSGSSMLGGASGRYSGYPSSMMGGYGQQMMGMSRYPQQMIGSMSGMMPGMMGGVGGMVPGMMGGQYGQYGQQQMGGSQGGQYGGSSMGGSNQQSGSSSFQTTPRYGNNQW